MPVNTTANPNPDGVQAGGSPSVPKKRVIGLVVGWLAAGLALPYAVMLLEFSWTFMSLSPRADGLSVSLLISMPATLAAIWFLAKRTHDRISQVVSGLVCLVVVGCAARWFPISTGGQAHLGWLWFERACHLVLWLPAGFWLWHLWLPDATRAGRQRIIATATCVLILAGVAFNAWCVRERAELYAKAANEPKQKDLGDQISEAFADALMKGGPAPKPGLTAWQQIRVGLSREEVLAILGQPATKTKPHSPVNAAAATEWWEYGYSSPIGTGAVDPKAYAIYFGDNGHVTSFQEPTESSK